METSVMQLFADALSMVTILSCLFLKVPQIMYIKEKKSAEGIYIQAMLMEITGFSIMTLYNFTNKYSLMTYLEYPIILLQVYVLVYYTLKYNNILNRPIVPLISITYIATVAGFAFNILPKEYLTFLVCLLMTVGIYYTGCSIVLPMFSFWVFTFFSCSCRNFPFPLEFGTLKPLQPFCTPLSGFAKVTYIYGIIKAANADAVSLTTWIISVSTNLARAFTVYVDSADLNLLSNFLISTVLSLSVLMTAFYYQLKPTNKQSKRKSVHRKQSLEHED